MKQYWLAFLTALLLSITICAEAQPTLEKDYSYVMEIPSVITMESSLAHLYVLSDSEGMAVFRSYPDSLQWLYSSTGMEQRGNTVTADIRFAYLYGNSRRLTVLEPTSVLGVYSSTILPSNPRDAQRIDQKLYVALGNKGLAELSLQTPASVDSTINLIERSRLSDKNIIDLESSADQLFALATDRTLYRFNYSDGSLLLSKKIAIPQNLTGIYLVNNTLMGSNKRGDIFEISSQGELSQLGSIGEAVSSIEAWNDWLIIRGTSNRLWTSYQNRRPKLWKEDRDAGNYVTVSKDDLWLSEYDKISKIVSSQDSGAQASSATNSSGSSNMQLSDIDNYVIPHSKPLLFPVKVQNAEPKSVQLSYQSPGVTNAEIRGHSFYWAPTSNDIGNHRIKIIATTNSGQTDSTSFNIEVKSFNAPPRFAPIRPISIPVGEAFSLPFKATDPDGMNADLVRFLGVNMPEGASIDEQTGEFNWTPTTRQTGKNQFRIIATDQYGAATSVDVTINVIENVQRGNSGK
jgi:hypothetical protein